MSLNLESLKREVPLVWFLEREYYADLFVSTNTMEIAGEDDAEEPICHYIRCADRYRKYHGVRNTEKYVIVADNLNVAKKTSFLFAGDVKGGWYKTESGDVLNDEANVVMAEINMHRPAFHERVFPGFSYDIDGAIFYGAESEDDLKSCFDSILTCETHFISVVINEEMAKTESVRKLIFDYQFDYLDLRNLKVTEDEAEKLAKTILQDNDSESGSGENSKSYAILDEKSEKGDDEDEYIDIKDDEIMGRIKKLMKARGDSFREEDIIRLIELSITEERLYGLIKDDNEEENSSFSDVIY